MTLVLPIKLLNALQRHAAAEYPHEACGLLLGKEGRVHTFAPMYNIMKEMDDELGPMSIGGYEIDAEEALVAEITARAKNLDVIGIYHSHTHWPAVPSLIDIAGFQNGHSYLIISNPKMEARSWRLNGEEIKEEEVQLVVQ